MHMTAASAVFQGFRKLYQVELLVLGRFLMRFQTKNFDPWHFSRLAGDSQFISLLT